MSMLRSTPLLALAAATLCACAAPAGPSQPEPRQVAVPAPAMAAPAAQPMPEMPAPQPTAAADASALHSDILSPPSEAAAQYLRGGIRAQDDGDVEAAFRHYGMVIQIAPDYGVAHAMAATVAPNPEASRRLTERAEELRPTASPAERLLIDMVVLGDGNDTQGQLAAARGLTELAPENPRGWIQRGLYLSQLGREDEARASLRRAAGVAPGFWLAHAYLANALALNAPPDLEAAEAAALRAVELAPEVSTAHDILGDVYRAQNRLELARDAYTRASDAAPDRGLPLQQRAHVNAFLGAYDHARADYDAAIERSTGNEKAQFEVYRAYTSVHEGRPAAAVEELERLASRIETMDVPDSEDARLFALYSAAMIAAHHGLWPAAERLTHQVTGIFRSRAEGLEADAANWQLAGSDYWEGMLAAQRGQRDRAMEKARAFMGHVAHSSNPRRDEAAHHIMALAELKAGDHEAAVAHYEQTNPNDIYAVHHHALALEALGRIDEARPMFDRVARHTFNALGAALVRADAAAKR